MVLRPIPMGPHGSQKKRGFHIDGDLWLYLCGQIERGAAIRLRMFARWSKERPKAWERDSQFQILPNAFAMSRAWIALSDLLQFESLQNEKNEAPFHFSDGAGDKIDWPAGQMRAGCLVIVSWGEGNCL